VSENKSKSQRGSIFVDVEAKAQKHDTFCRVSDNVIDQIRAGDLAKICTGGERFWVIVTSIDADLLHGQASNHLHRTEQHGLKHGDFVSFERRHILDVDKQRVAVA